MKAESSVSRGRRLVPVVFVLRFLCCLAVFQCIAPEEDWTKGSSGISCFVIQHVDSIKNPRQPALDCADDKHFVHVRLPWIGRRSSELGKEVQDTVRRSYPTATPRVVRPPPGPSREERKMFCHGCQKVLLCINSGNAVGRPMLAKQLDAFPREFFSIFQKSSV